MLARLCVEYAGFDRLLPHLWLQYLLRCRFFLCEYSIDLRLLRGVDPEPLLAITAHFRVQDRPWSQDARAGFNQRIGFAKGLLFLFAQLQNWVDSLVAFEPKAHALGFGGIRNFCGLLLRRDFSRLSVYLVGFGVVPALAFVRLGLLHRHFDCRGFVFLENLIDFFKVYFEVESPCLPNSFVLLLHQHQQVAAKRLLEGVDFSDIGCWSFLGCWFWQL